MAGLTWILGGLAGGISGALIWILVGYFTGYEVGYIAWGVGVLAGLGIVYGASKSGVESTVAHGVGAAAIALASVAGAKYAVSYLQIENEKGELLAVAEANPPTDESMIAQIANQIEAERGEAVENVPRPKRSLLLALPAEEKDYRPGIWAEAKGRWQKLTPAERDQRKQQVIDADVKAASVKFDIARGQAFKNSFTPWDLLWAFLALGSAFKIGSGSHASDE